MTWIRHDRVLAGCLALTTLSGFAAQADGAPPPAAQPLASPQVLVDGRVTFRLHAPTATEVSVTGDWVTQGRGKDGALSRDARGDWSITVGPLVPDVYSYSFSVNGVHTVDPLNPAVKQGIHSVDSLFEVTGAASQYEDPMNVPHGDVRSVWYYATTLRQMRRMQVYTPPGYDRGERRYPVLVLVAGGGDDDTAWSTIGRAGFILDNLIAAGKAKPMIVVMPNGNLSLPDVPAITFGGTAQEPSAVELAARMSTLSKLQDAFADELLQDVMPLVAQRYRVSRGPAAIAGMALGGAQTLRVAPLHLDRFGYIGIFSEGLQQGIHASISPDFEQRNAAFFADAARTNARLKRFWIGIGRDDSSVQQGARKLSDLLSAHGVRNEYHESDGGHTWINWRHNLADFAPLLFQ